MTIGTTPPARIKRKINLMFEQHATRTAYESRVEALKLAFAPMMFQAARVARDVGLLEALDQQREDGNVWAWVSRQTLESSAKLDDYALAVLLDAAHAIGLVETQNEQYRLTRMGHFVLHDQLTRVNMDFVHDVCYRGMFHLDESLEKGQPAGLQTLGDWSTIYEGLSQLPDRVRESWLNFDHYYSDQSFDAAIPFVFDRPVKHLVDIGGNTGRWTRKCLEHDKQVRITLVDLERQLPLAREQLETAGLIERVDLWPTDLLHPHPSLPTDADVVWMSQFLCCFSLSEIVTILRNARASLAPEGRLLILETFPDQQQYDIAAHCLMATSLYFTCMANGNSRIYHSDDLHHCIHEAGLKIVSEQHQLGMGHSLLQCQVAR